MIFTVTVYRPRPDHLVFRDLLFEPGRNLDSDGDADPVWSRNWRDLYLKDRESSRPKIEIYAPEEYPSLFDVASEDTELATLAALYLYIFCGEIIEHGSLALGSDNISALSVRYSAELARAKNQSGTAPAQNTHFRI